MLKDIFILTDYKRNFGSKWDAVPYNSGMDKNLLSKIFMDNGYSVKYLEFSEVKGLSPIKGKIILYTSSEDIGYFYKDFIEDIILFLELEGAIVLPSYKFLRANNNKVFMELSRRSFDENANSELKSWVFGSADEILNYINEYEYPIVVKESLGAQGKGVFLASSEKELLKITRKVSRTFNIYQDIKDRLRIFKHKGYKYESLYRRKFILQEFVPDLSNDWKILIYGNKLFILTRHIRKDDFRASGSKYKYLAGSESVIEDGLLDFAYNYYLNLNVPNISLDIIYEEGKFYVIEFQAIYFGTSTINLSDAFYLKTSKGWELDYNIPTVEQLYTESIIEHLNRT